MANFLNKTPSKGGKEKQKMKAQVQVRDAQMQSGSQRAKRTNYVLEPPRVPRKGNGKLERTINLE